MLSRLVLRHLAPRNACRPAAFRLLTSGRSVPPTNPTTNTDEVLEAEGAESVAAVDSETSAAVGDVAAVDEEPAATPDIVAMADLIEEKTEKINDITDQLLRALAEMENVRNRAKRDVDNAHKYAVQGFAKDLLDVNDNLNRALENVDMTAVNDSNPQLSSLVEGLKLTEMGLASKFRKYGVEKMSLELGSPFDPNFQTALFEQESDAGVPGTIASIIVPGYMFKDRVLRSASVSTFKKKPEQSAA